MPMFLPGWRSQREDAQYNASNRHDDRRAEQQGECVSLVVREIDATQADHEECRGRKRADWEASSHLAEQRSLADVHRRYAELPSDFSDNR
jgi:hypothetical protein